jgi:N-acetylmuramidase
MNFKGKAKRLDDIDLPMIGREIGVGEDEIHAVLDVEAAGSGFDKLGRPKMLFEPHVFWRELGKGPKRDKAAALGLAYPQWKRNYPADSYPRLAQAMAIDEEAALRSASWGLGQIMGFNCQAAGYPFAKAMVLAFMDDEEAHLRAMIRFIRTNGLDDELRRHDWKGFARGYNGPGFAKNGYDRKLAAAFAKWHKIKDTPIPASPSPVSGVKPAPRPVDAPKPTTKPVVDRIAPDPVIKPSAPPPPPSTNLHKTQSAPPAAYVAAVAAAVAAAWQWGADLIDFLTFWN